MVSLLAFTSCASEYKIEGSSSVSRLDGKMLFVKVPSGDRMLSIDSAEVIHGMFKMEGITDSTSMASLYMDDESIMPFVIEKGKISISIDNARIVVTGTPLNDRLYDFVGKKTSPCQGKGYAIVFAIPMKKDFADWRKCFYFVGANQNIEACYGF